MDKNNNKDLEANNIFSGMLRSQLLATTAVAIIAYIISGKHGCLSAFAGGLSVVVSTFVASKLIARKRKDAASILMSMLKAELVKLVLIVLFLFGVFKGYKDLVSGALIAGLAVAAIVSGATISKIKR